MSKLGIVGRVAVVAVLGLLLAGCQWSLPRFAADGSGHNTSEHDIGTANVATLAIEQTVPFALGAPDLASSDPVFAGTTMFVTSTSPAGAVRAYRIGDPSCAGATPAACTPIWSSAAVAGAGQAVVANGRVFVPVGDDVHVYDAAGVEGCGGTPVRCNPVWTAPGWGRSTVNGATYRASVLVAGGRLLVTLDRRMAAFDAAGVTGCSGSPLTCGPRWTYVDAVVSGGEVALSLPSVADGIVYVGLAVDEVGYDNGGYTGGVRAIDAAGVEGCSGTPVVCTPLWQAYSPGAVGNPPAVVDGRLLVGWVHAHEVLGDDGPYTERTAGAAAYDLATCAASGSSCPSTWQSTVWTRGRPGSVGVAVADGLVHVVNEDVGAVTFAVTGGPGCGAAVPCTPVRSYAVPGAGGAPGSFGPDPAVANGVLYIGASAFAANGGPTCAGVPVTCAPLWSAGTAASRATTVVSNGRVVVSEVGVSTGRYGLYRLP